MTGTKRNTDCNACLCLPAATHSQEETNHGRRCKHRDACIPEKLALVAAELLKDEGCANPTFEDVLHAIGASIAWAYIDAASDPLDIDGASRAVEVSTEAAFELHHRVVMASQNFG